MSSFRVVLGFTATLSLAHAELELCKYESKFVAIFNVIDREGALNWAELKDSAVLPYFSFCHSLIRRRAEETLLAAGFRGIHLPTPDNLIAGKEGNTSGEAAATPVKPAAK